MIKNDILDYFLTSYSYYRKRSKKIYKKLLEKLRISKGGITPEKPEFKDFDLGLYLKTAREEAGFTIEEISYKLKTKKEYIVDLEANRFDEILRKVYLYDLINKYRNFLNVGVEVDINKIMNKIYHKGNNINYIYEQNISNNKIDQDFVKYGFLVFLGILLIVYIFSDSSFVHDVEYFKKKLK